MYKIRCMYKMQSLGDLIDDIPSMLFSEYILAYKRIQIDIHALKKYVDILLITRRYDFLHLYDVRMPAFL